MQVNYIAIIIATVVQFIIGAVWCRVLFGKLWGKMNGFDKLPKETQDKLAKSMGPFYGLQFLMTLLSTFVLALFVVYLPLWNSYAMAGFFWLGFIFPVHVSAALFGTTERKWIVKKIAVQTILSLICIEAAAIILRLFMK